MITPFPLFNGPSDPGALRDYLNKLILYINDILLDIGTGNTENVIANYAANINDGFLRVDCSKPNLGAGGDIFITLPALLSATRVLKIQKIDSLSQFYVRVITPDAAPISGNTTYAFNEPGGTRIFDPTSETQWDIT